MLMTVPSMKARLEPRMVAARTHALACPEHGTWAPVDRTMASSHGVLMEGTDNLSGRHEVLKIGEYSAGLQVRSKYLIEEV